MLLKDIRFLITQNPDRDVLENVDVHIDDGRITEIGDNLTKDGEVVDCSDRIVMPGLVNTHTHVPMNLMRGLSDNKVLEDWLEEDIFPAETCMDEHSTYYGTLHAVIEMLKTGTTCFNDMYAPEKPVADAVHEAGVRAVLARGMTDTDGDADDKLQESKQFIEQYEDHDRITPAVAPHAVYTCSSELLQRAKDQADTYNTLYHIHLSETMHENSKCEDKHGRTPTAYLDKLDVLDDRFIGAHGVWLTEHDVNLLKEVGAGIAHNPCSNLKLGSGVADIPRLHAHNVPVGLATDSVASNNNLNMFEEAKFAALLQKRRDPRIMTEQDALDMMTVHGAELLGLDNEIGSLEEGKQADITTISLHDETLHPFHGTRGLLSNLVFSFHGHVTDVYVQGTPLRRNGNLQTIDSDTVKRECRRHATRIHQHTQDLHEQQ